MRVKNAFLVITQSGQSGSRPKYFSAQRWNEEHAAHAFSECVLERVEHGDVALFSHLIGEKHATEDQTEGVAERRLAPNQSFTVDLFGRSGDVTTSDPCSYKSRLCSIRKSEFNNRVLSSFNFFLSFF